MAFKYTELDNRRFFKWGDFLIENQNSFFDKEEIEYVTKMVDKGNLYQKILEKKVEDFYSYEKYIKTMLLYISLQDSVIEDIINFQKCVKEYRENLEIKKPRVYYRLDIFN